MEGVASFEATDALDESALHALLAGDRPEARVWAAWRIALRTGRVVPHLTDHVIGEPSAGVRRALLVVLAGHGEVDALVALARHDPSVDVRAAAMTLVTRFAVQGAIPKMVVLEAFAAGAPAVRAAILGGVPPGAPDPLRALVLDALAQGDGPDRVDAFEAALRIRAPETQEAAMRWLGAAPVAHAADAWRRLQERPHDEIVSLVLRTTVTMRARALAVLTGIPLAALAELAIDGHVRTFEIIRERHDFADAPPALLARGILSGAAVGFVELLAAHLRSVSVMPETVAPLVPRLRAHVRARLAAIEDGQLLPEESPRWRWNARGCYHGLFGELQRLR